MRKIISVLIFLCVIGIVNACTSEFTIDSSNMNINFFVYNASTATQLGTNIQLCGGSGSAGAGFYTNTTLFKILPDDFDIIMQQSKGYTSGSSVDFILRGLLNTSVIDNKGFNTSYNSLEQIRVGLYTKASGGGFFKVCDGIDTSVGGITGGLTTANFTYVRFTKVSGSTDINLYWSPNGTSWASAGSCLIGNINQWRNQALVAAFKISKYNAPILCSNFTKIYSNSSINNYATVSIINQNALPLSGCNVTNVQNIIGVPPYYSPITLATDEGGLTDTFTYNPSCDYLGNNYGYANANLIESSCCGYGTQSNLMYEKTSDSPLIYQVLMINESIQDTCFKTATITDLYNNGIPSVKVTYSSANTNQTVIYTDSMGGFADTFNNENYHIKLEKSGFLTKELDVNFCTRADNFYVLDSIQNNTYNFYVNITKGNSNANLNNVKVTISESDLTSDICGQGTLYKYGFASTLGVYNFNITTAKKGVHVFIEYVGNNIDIFDCQTVTLNKLQKNYYLNFDLYIENISQCINFYKAIGACDNSGNGVLNYSSKLLINGTINANNFNPISLLNANSYCWTSYDFLTYKGLFSSVGYSSINPTFSFEANNLNKDFCLPLVFNQNNLVNLSGYIIDADTKNPIDTDISIHLHCTSLDKDVYTQNGIYTINNLIQYEWCTLSHYEDNIYSENSYDFRLNKPNNVNMNMSLIKIRDNQTVVKYNFLNFHVKEALLLNNAYQNIKDVSVKCTNIPNALCTTDKDGLCSINKIEQGLTCSLFINKDGYTGYSQKITQFNKLYEIELTNNDMLSCSVNGNVQSIDTNKNIEYLENVIISVYDNNILVNTGLTDSNGDYNLAVKCGKSYKIKADYIGNILEETVSVSGNEGSSSQKNFIFKIADIEKSNKITEYLNILWMLIPLILLIIGIFIFVILLAGISLLIKYATNLGGKN